MSGAVLGTEKTKMNKMDSLEGALISEDGGYDHDTQKVGVIVQLVLENSENRGSFLFR